MKIEEREIYVDELSKRVGIKAKSLDELKVKGLLVYRTWTQENLRGFCRGNLSIGKIICKRFKLQEEQVKEILKKEKKKDYMKYYMRDYRKKLKKKNS